MTDRSRRVLGLLLALAMTGMVTAPQVYAESAVGDPNTTFSLNPNASGTKVTGTMTIAYDQGAPCNGTFFINNMWVVLFLTKGNLSKPFDRDLLSSGLSGFCFSDQVAQENFVRAIIENDVIPFFFNCTAGVNCPSYEVKTMTTPLPSGTGALAANITLAVH